jgi:hypothetical protein
MTPNRCKTIVGLPCARELDHEPFELRARMVRLPAPPRPLVSTHTRLRHPAPERRARRGLQEFSVSAAVVFMLGCALLAVLGGCNTDPTSVALVPATAAECPQSAGYVLLVDGEVDSFVCESPGESPSVLAGQIFCSSVVPDLLLTLNARIIFTDDGYVLGLCGLSAAAEGLTSSQAFDPAAWTCSLPSYGTDSLDPIVISVTDSGVLVSGAVEGTMRCEGVEL